MVCSKTQYNLVIILEQQCFSLDWCIHNLQYLHLDESLILPLLLFIINFMLKWYNSLLSCIWFRQTTTVECRWSDYDDEPNGLWWRQHDIMRDEGGDWVTSLWRHMYNMTSWVTLQASASSAAMSRFPSYQSLYA